MRKIEGRISEEMAAFINKDNASHEVDVAKADAYPVNTYRQLMEQLAKLSYYNRQYLLFFRGQGIDFRNRAEASSFYPSIYRGDYVSQHELDARFRELEHAAQLLRNHFKEENIDGYSDLREIQNIQWSILQHYEVCPTPLLDLTQSPRVACSFAQEYAEHGRGYISVFGLPYLNDSIAQNTFNRIVNVRLLSICPPAALRPYFQEGFLAGTLFTTNEYDSKDILDFRRRLIAKFEIPSQKRFWGPGFTRIPSTVLYPVGDKIGKICKKIDAEIHTETAL